MRLLIICCLLFTASYLAFAQESDDFLAYKLQSAVIKNFAFSEMLSKSTVYLAGGKSVYPNNDISRALAYPGFGYSQLIPAYYIKSIPSPLINAELQVFELSLKIDQEWDKRLDSYNTLLRFNDYAKIIENGYQRLSWADRLLVASDGDKVIYLGGFPLNDDIQYLFDIDWMNPLSLTPYLMTRYHRLFDSVSYVATIGEDYIFGGLRLDEQGSACLRRYIVVGKQTHEIRQERFIDDSLNLTLSLEYCQDSGSFIKKRDPLPFPNFDSKKNHLFDALMRNMFSYGWIRRGIQFQDSLFLEEKKNIYPNIDAILPNFDEYLKHFELVTYPYCQNTTIRALERHADFYPLIERVGAVYDQSLSKKQVGFGITDSGIEFYRIMVSKPTMLFRKKSSLTTVQIDEWTVEGEWYRYPTLLKDDLDDKYTLGSSNLPTMVTLPVNCETYGLSNFKMEKEVNCPYPFDYYLLALNKKTREVYFISGPDILLSECVDLYNLAPSNVAFIDWDRNLQLSYIQDRLYQYQIPMIIESEHIQSISDDKMLLRIPGVIRSKPVMLSVEINLLSPEDILVIVE